MSFTHTVTHQTKYADESNQVVSLENVDAQSAGEVHNISESIADSTTDGLVAFTYDFSQGKTFLMWSTVAMTVKTNNAGSPIQTFTLVANVPIIWSAGQASAVNPITTDITALYVSNASGGAGILNIRALQDPTV